MTEKAVAQMIGNQMLEGGCDSLKCQVGSGVRSGITNCTPTDKAIEQGDVMRVEILGDMKQYRSNVTRTAVVGEPTAEQRRIWEVMIGAREACKAMLKPGTAVADLYRTYVKYLRDRGIEPTLKFLGHGIGQTIHEEPYITETRTRGARPQHHLHDGAALHDARAAWASTSRTCTASRRPDSRRSPARSRRTTS